VGRRPGLSTPRSGKPGQAPARGGGPLLTAGLAAATLVAAAITLSLMRRVESPQLPLGAQERAASVSVDTRAQQGLVKTRLSTNLVTPGLLDQSPVSKGLLSSWAPELVRLHAGSDTGDPPALPSGSRQGDWNFGPLDQMAVAVRSYGGAPLLNVRYAPNWMWTCSDFFGKGTAAVGGLRDRSFTEFGDYMARLVGWYNKGGFTDERGVVHSSGHQDWVHYWEVWNEPDSSSETPCHPQGDGPALTPDQYAAMWNVVVSKMLAVDPTLKLVGPATSDPLPEYIQAVMQRTQRPPDVVSYHAYGGSSNSQSNQEMFEGLTNVLAGADSRWGRPIWVTEINLNSGWGEDPHGRPSGAFGVAWGASAFRAMVLGGIELAHQFEFISTPQFGMLDQNNGVSRLAYWRDVLLSQAFPAGSTIVRSTSSLDSIETLAARRPDGILSVLVINRRLTGPSDVGNSGVPATVSVHLQGLTPSAVSLRQIDPTTDAAHPPTTVSLAAASDLQFTSPGYGLAILEIAESAVAASQATPAPPARQENPSPPAAASNTVPAPALAHDERYFPETGFRIEDDAVWQYFQSHGRDFAFGYPVSRPFVFLGCPIQIFQRQVPQVCSGRPVALLNLLDPDILPYTRINGSTFPGDDPDLKTRAPKVTDADYATSVIGFVRANAPDEFEGRTTRYGQTFFATITPDQAGTQDRGIVDLLNLDIWGMPISHPQPDPANANFIYQRFQRGIMHHNVADGTTRGVLVADYLKQILQNSAALPADLRDQARTSKFFGQYCPGASRWLCRSEELAGTDLTFAFEDN